MCFEKTRYKPIKTHIWMCCNILCQKPQTCQLSHFEGHYPKPLLSSLFLLIPTFPPVSHITGPPTCRKCILGLGRSFVKSWGWGVGLKFIATLLVDLLYAELQQRKRSASVLEMSCKVPLAKSDFSIDALHCHPWPYWRELNTGGRMYRKVEWGGSPQGGVRKGFDEGLANAVHTTQLCQQWDGILCSEENLHMQAVGHHWWMTQLVPVWHWIPIVDRCCSGQPCWWSHPSTGKEGHLHIQAALKVSSHMQWQKRGVKKILKV